MPMLVWTLATPPRTSANDRAPAIARRHLLRGVRPGRRARSGALSGPASPGFDRLRQHGLGAARPARRWVRPARAAGRPATSSTRQPACKLC